MAYTTIKKPSDYFNTVLYTGNGTDAHAITGTGFKPDMTWIKARSALEDHCIFDVVRGSTKRISPNTTGATWDSSTNIQSFDVDGFTIGTSNQLNASSQTQVSWNWLASNTTASNTDGSTTSTVSANTTSGFSIVSYTGNETTGATVGHSLGSVPKMIIFKNRSSTDDWVVYHESLGNTQSIRLNLTNAAATTPASFNNTSPTSSVFTLGDWTGVNGSSMIAYCFAEKQGFSKFGSYTGNGSADGAFIYTGFKPAFLIWKRSDVANDWYVVDNKRDTFNITDAALFPNLNGAESDGGGSYNGVDFLSNGFKVRTSNSSNNASGGTFIYMAFAEEPLVGDNPATAR